MNLVFEYNTRDGWVVSSLSSSRTVLYLWLSVPSSRHQEVRSKESLSFCLNLLCFKIFLIYSRILLVKHRHHAREGNLIQQLLFFSVDDNTV